MIIKLSAAIILTGILIHKVYRRRNPLPEPKVPHTEEWKIPAKYRLEVCKLYDALWNAKGQATFERLSMWEYICKAMEESNQKWPDNHSAKIEFDDACPVVIFTENL